jgi:hypothetical protein
MVKGEKTEQLGRNRTLYKPIFCSKKKYFEYFPDNLSNKSGHIGIAGVIKFKLLT